MSMRGRNQRASDAIHSLYWCSLFRGPLDGNPTWLSAPTPISLVISPKTECLYPKGHSKKGSNNKTGISCLIAVISSHRRNILVVFSTTPPPSCCSRLVETPLSTLVSRADLVTPSDSRVSIRRA